MRVVVFFLSLCFLLLKGYNYAHAEIPHTTPGYTAGHSFEKLNQIKLARPDQDHFSITSNSTNQKKEELISLEIEDEDLSFSRKYILTRCLLALIYASALFFLASYLKKRLPYCWHLSYTSSFKYILERALRI